MRGGNLKATPVDGGEKKGEFALSSYEKVKNYCEEIGGIFEDKKSFISETITSGVCTIRLGDTFLTGWKDSDRVDLDKRGINFVFDLDRISCLPNKEAGCYIKGMVKEKEAENIYPFFFVSKISGIEGGDIRFDTESKSFPLMTIFGDR